MVDICGYELPTNLRSFTQKDLYEVKILEKVLEGLLFETPYMVTIHSTISTGSY